MANQSELAEPTRRERLLLPPALDYENAPTEALELRLRQLLANTDLSLTGPYGAQLTTIGEVLERRRAATLGSLAPVPARAEAEYDAASALQKIHDFEVLCSTTKSERWEQLRTEYARRVLDGEDVQPVIEAAVIAKGGYSREEGVLRLVRRLVIRRLRDNSVKLAAATAGTQVATNLTSESSREHAAGAADDSNGNDTETQAAAAETATSSATNNVDNLKAERRKVRDAIKYRYRFHDVLSDPIPGELPGINLSNAEWWDYIGLKERHDLAMAIKLYLEDRKAHWHSVYSLTMPSNSSDGLETSIRRAEVASSQDRQVPEQSRREKKLVRRNQKYKTIDEALKKVADSRPQTQEEVFKALEGRVVSPPAEPFETARGWMAGFRRDEATARAWLSKRWRELNLPPLPRGPKNQKK
jgi:hypothetical protein